MTISFVPSGSKSPLSSWFSWGETKVCLLLILLGAIVYALIGLTSQGTDWWVMTIIVSLIFIPLFISMALLLDIRLLLIKQSPSYSVHADLVNDNFLNICIGNASSQKAITIKVKAGSHATWFRTRDLNRDPYGTISFTSTDHRSAMRTVFFPSHSSTLQFLRDLCDHGILVDDVKIVDITSSRAILTNLIPPNHREKSVMPCRVKK
ncbi:MAG: hypothetical protein LAT64_02215 [Phycisphaerales bacterium]|nr:hypothetical protein [Planctomycetota bacterium]MCH8507573.1 hypothetical protein [Phycisphaerales bacterium]